MIQKFFGIVLAIAGVLLILNQSWWLGAGVIVFGVAIANGAQHGTWISFDFGNSDGSDGGGDGGGGD